jgi:NAD(P)-dependent dehydrogenase (short-subunit alcohol dehydrogenase family)
MAILEGARLQTPIAALPGEDSETVQPLLESFARELAARGARVAGVAQTRIPDRTTGRKRIALRDLTSGALYPISQDLGSGSVACNLDTAELAQACAMIERAVARGADLVVISKFSKQEASRGGLSDAFRAAMVAKVPVATAVSPHYLAEWREFSGPLAEFVAPEKPALFAWWERIRARAPMGL